MIAGLAYELPQHVVPSSELEAQLADTVARLRLPRNQIVGLTGVAERRFWGDGVSPSDAATRAARKLLETTGTAAADIGLIVSTSVSKDYVEPSVACLVHGNLGLPAHCMNFDVGNACLGFLDGMLQAALILDAGWARHALVVAGESSREVVEATIQRLRQSHVTIQEFHRHFATLTLGSGAVAMLLGRAEDHPDGHHITGAVTLADTSQNRLCLGQRDQMLVDPAALLQAGVALAQRTWQVAERDIPNWRDEQIDVYVPHQVSTKHVQSVGKALGMTPEKVQLNVETLGNIGPAALPITLAQAAEAGRLKAGDAAGLMGIGSGLNCTMMGVRW